MILKYILVTSLVFLPLVTFAQEQEPRPNPNGDFSNPTWHGNWVVVDPDRKGLNCRWSPKLPKGDWDSINVNWPDDKFGTWPVVRIFPNKTRLTAFPTNAGTSMKDNRGLPWLIVDLGDGRACLVRANNKFIKPD